MPSETSVRALAGELEVEPVLAMKRGGGAAQQLGRVPLQPDQVRRLHAGVQGAAGVAIDEIAHAAAVSRGRCRPRASPARARPAHRLAVAVDQPGAVALPGDRQRRRPPGEVRHVQRQVAQHGRRIVPGAGHVLLGAAARQVDIDIGAAGRRQLVAVEVERHGLDDRGAGVDADDQILPHAAAASRAARPCCSAVPLSAANRCMAAGGRLPAPSRRPRRRCGGAATTTRKQPCESSARCAWSPSH